MSGGMVKVRFLGPGEFKTFRVLGPGPGAGLYTFERGRVTECPVGLAKELALHIYEGCPPEVPAAPMYEIVEGGEE